MSLWHKHPGVRSGDQLTAGERAADKMRNGLGTWTFLFVFGIAMAVWMLTDGFGSDAAPFILLNLCLSTLAGLQAAVLLIAAKRSDQVASETAVHTYENTQALRQLLEQNTQLTEAIHAAITTKE